MTMPAPAMNLTPQQRAMLEAAQMQQTTAAAPRATPVEIHRMNLANIAVTLACAMETSSSREQTLPPPEDVVGRAVEMACGIISRVNKEELPKELET